MPGLEKIKRALVKTPWYQNLDPQKIIVVAGTNGKGSTCAMLESLLLEADQRVGFYSSPHLISTTERIRFNGAAITEDNFVQVFHECEELIKNCELSHFEALTLMAGQFYFSDNWKLQLDYVIFEVGLGGTYDATNAFPHAYSVITTLGLDHTNILGNTLAEVAQNKFGIVQAGNTVIHQPLHPSLKHLKEDVEEETNSQWYEVPEATYSVIRHSREPEYRIKTMWGQANLALPGERAAQNAMAALYTFEKLGFSPILYMHALADTNWPGRMQKTFWPHIAAPVYLSGDHNPDGIKSLLNILNDFSWNNLHIIVGIGIDKNADDMLAELVQLKNCHLHLTVTPFKGRKLSEYPEKYLAIAKSKNENPIEILNSLKDQTTKEDMILITGSLYLVGEFLKEQQN